MTTAMDMLPIREVARVTGVNPVTLRAWERRYGLIQPHRTDKGHRLYTTENIDQIRDILLWLNRGVAVSQIKGLLSTAIPESTPADSPWDRLRTHFLDAMLCFDGRRADQHYDQSIANNPTATVCAQLLEPVLAHLLERWQGQFGTHLEEVFVHTWLQTRLSSRVHQNNRHATGQPIVIANLAGTVSEPEIWLLGSMLSSEGYAVELLNWEIPASELALLTEKLDPLAVVLYSSQALNLNQLRRQLPKLASKHAAILYAAGPATIIHAEEWQALGVQPLAGRPTAVHQTLLDLLRPL